MLLYLALACFLTLTAGAPLLYDQRQDGDVNVAADVQNVVFVFAIPKKMSLPLDFLDDFLKTKKNSRDSIAQDRADHVMEAFVEPNTPYQVEIGGNDRSAEGEGRAVEVVISGRRRAGPEIQNEDEIKLIGATEQCGPDRQRDPVTLTCLLRVDSATELQTELIPEPQKELIPKPTPEVVPS